MHTETTKFRTASYILMAAALLVILYFRFLPLLLSIILTYIFINRTNGLILWMRHRLLPHNTFLHRSLNEGRNLYAMLPYLRAYMGHEKFSDTAYYIHILPERLMVSPGVQWDNIDCIGMGVDIWEH